MGKYLQDKGLAPAIVLCSSATRAQETLEQLRPAFSDSTVVKIEPKLYGAESTALATRLRRVSQGSPSVLVIGHDPAIQELVLMLDPSSRRSKAVRKKFPTAALAVVDVSIDEWKQLKPGEASISDFITPKQLR